MAAKKAAPAAETKPDEVKPPEIKDLGDGKVELNGHTIDTNETPLARFLDGESGQPISDEEWDEQKLRLEGDYSNDEIEFDSEPAPAEAPEGWDA